MTLKEELDARRAEFLRTAPKEKAQAYQRGVDELVAAGTAARAVARAVGEQRVAERDARVAQRCGIGKVALPAESRCIAERSAEVLLKPLGFRTIGRRKIDRADAFGRRWHVIGQTIAGRIELPGNRAGCERESVVRVGNAVLGIFLATQHRQEPPEKQIVGAPRIGLRVGRGRLGEILRKRKTDAG